MRSTDSLDDGALLGFTMREHEIRAIDANHRAMGGNDHDLRAVELPDLERGVLRCSGHAAEVRIAAEEPLQRNRAEDLTIATSRQAFLLFERRLQAIGPHAVVYHAPRELIDDFDPSVSHDVVDIALQENVCVQRAVDLRQQPQIFRHV
jgi:hypothetical protein